LFQEIWLGPKIKTIIHNNQNISVDILQFQTLTYLPLLEKVQMESAGVLSGELLFK
jgi:hypothetical protein